VLLLRGDAIKSEVNFFPDPEGHNYAVDLVKQVVRMNKGTYLDDELADVAPSNFCIGVAGYPEKHFEAPNMKSDLKHLKEKVESGAEYIVTQMFFDNQKYFEFVKACREIGIECPIIPGLKPITTKRQATVLAKTFHIDLPETLLDEIEKAESDKDVKEIGVEWCIQQCKELIKFGAPCLHIYTMGNAENTCRVARGVL
jgi:methylenetetrahydrofolate reductase (NADPH)